MNAPTAPSILEAGLGHMKDRAVTYDKPQGERSMGATVAAFNAVTGHQLTEEQGWLFQVLLKAVRSQQGAFRLDCYEDGAAYFGLMGEAAAASRRIVGFDPASGVDKGCTVLAHRDEKGALVIDDVRFDEARADIIGQNGNDGAHYAELEPTTFGQLADQLEPPKPQQTPVPPPAPAALPATDDLVDPTGRPKWEHVPSWAKWIGQDRQGVWTAFAHKPEPRTGRWFTTKRYAELNSGEPLIGENWVHTLEERP